MNYSEIKNHPIRDVYNHLRTSRLNIKYFSIKLNKIRRKNFEIEFIIALTASSGVTGLWFWDSLIGGYAWKILGSITAILAVLKPLLNLTKKIKEKEELVTAYRSINYDIQILLIAIKQRKKYDKKLQKEFLKILDKEKDIIKQEKTEKEDKELIKECTREVNLELPINSFYIPEDY